MNQKHTLASYDQELKRLQELIVDMGHHGIVQMQAALDALESRSPQTAARVIDDDARADAWAVEVEDLVVQIIALRQPTASDLRHVTVAFKASVYLERIGDYAANVAKRSIVLPAQFPSSGTFLIPSMGKLALDMLRDTMRAYETLDASLATAAWQRDAALDSMTAVLFRELTLWMKDDSETIATGTHLMFIAKNLERVGDHATNICELIYYRVTGERLLVNRPKGPSSAGADIIR